MYEPFCDFVTAKFHHMSFPQDFFKSKTTDSYFLIYSFNLLIVWIYQINW